MLKKGATMKGTPMKGATMKGTPMKGTPMKGTPMKGTPMKGSLLEGIPSELPEEIFDTICSAERVKIERIVSRGHASPEGFWYDQERSEFVLVVRGSAGLRLENEDDIVVLKSGDYLNIGAHIKHRVEWTDPTCETIWLAVHY